MILAITSFIFS